MREGGRMVRMASIQLAARAIEMADSVAFWKERLLEISETVASTHLRPTNSSCR